MWLIMQADQYSAPQDVLGFGGDRESLKQLVKDAKKNGARLIIFKEVKESQFMKPGKVSVTVR